MSHHLTDRPFEFDLTPIDDSDDGCTKAVDMDAPIWSAPVFIKDSGFSVITWLYLTHTIQWLLHSVTTQTHWLWQSDDLLIYWFDLLFDLIDDIMPATTEYWVMQQVCKQ